MSEALTVPLTLTLRAMEREYVLAVLKKHRAVRQTTAKALGLTDKGLYNKLKSYGVADEYPPPKTRIKKGRNYGKANAGTAHGAGPRRPHARKAGRHHPQAFGLFDLASRRWGQEPQDRDRSAGEAD